MTIGVVSAAQQQELPDVGSTRIRVTWPLRYWPEAEVFRVGRRYDAVIFQKAYWVEYAARYDGIKLLDLCDPDFLDEQRARCLGMIERCDGVTCSTKALAAYVSRLTKTPVRVIPDRIDFAAIGARRKVPGDARTATAAWFGYPQNYPLLDLMIDALIDQRIPQLVVIGDPARPYVLPARAASRLALTNVAWSEATVYDDLLRADVVLNPRSRKGAWRFKSRNKTLLAWALGLPVAHSSHELRSLRTPAARQREAARRLVDVRAQWDVHRSVEEYRSLITEIGAYR